MQAFWYSLHQEDRFLATSFWLQKAALTWRSFLLPHLTYFVARFFAGFLRFCLGNSVSLIVSLAMGGMKSKGGDIAVSFSEWSL